jgi:hypothetical protein
MGCDIHVIFETKNEDGTWDLTFPKVPDPKYWYENIADQEEGDYAELSAKYEAIPMDEVLAKYGDDPRMNWDYQLPNSNEPNQFGYRIREIDDRDYAWFGAIAGVRGDGIREYWEPQGIPDDISPDGKAFIDRYGLDAHSESWLMVNEILANIMLAEFSQYKWLAECIPDPANTRMVFYFDN